MPLIFFKSRVTQKLPMQRPQASLAFTEEGRDAIAPANDGCLDTSYALFKFALRYGEIIVDKAYQHVGKSLTGKIARELIMELFSGEGEIEKKQIRQTIDETHTSRGGSLSTNELHPVSIALSTLKKQGLANNPAFGVWSIFSEPCSPGHQLFDIDAARTLGQGENAVYLYYYPAYRCLAEYEGKQHWACKIDSVVSEMPMRMPEPPEIHLVLRTDDSESLEQTLHTVLRFRGRCLSDVPGETWFLTSPSEVEGIYRNVVESA